MKTTTIAAGALCLVAILTFHANFNAQEQPRPPKPKEGETQPRQPGQPMPGQPGMPNMGGSAITVDGDVLWVVDSGTLFKIDKKELKVLAKLNLRGGGEQPGGIFNHQSRMARSRDGGKTFTQDDKLLFDHTSVPAACVLSDGKILLAFVDGEKHGLDIAIQKEDGWERFDAKIEGDNPASCVDPCLVPLKDGGVRLYYFGGFAEGGGDPARKEGDHEMRSAISTDGGRTFKREDGVRFAAPRITDPDVFQIDDGRWVMHVSDGPKLIVAISKDGLKFRNSGELEFGGGVCGTIKLKDGRYRCYLSGPGGLSSIISDDGLEWEKEEGVRISGPLGDPSPFIDPKTGDVIMVYKRIGGTPQGPQPR
jgi:hypothetical protein